MKKELLNLIEEVTEIESKFHKAEGVPGLPTVERIYDVQEFQNWIHELQFFLQDIVERTDDAFVKDTLEIVSSDFKGWNDRRDFNKIKAKLSVIQRNIDKYYTVSRAESEVGKVYNKKPKIFISHSSKDKVYVEEIVELVDFFGLNQTQIFCSSLPGYDIPINENIYDYLQI